MPMRTKFAAPILAAVTLVGWQTVTSRSALGQDKNDPAALAGTPAVLPRPDFHFPGKDPLPKCPAKLAADFVYDGKPDRQLRPKRDRSEFRPGTIHFKGRLCEH